MKKKLTATLLAGLASATAALTLVPSAASASTPIAYWRESTAGLNVNGTYARVVGDFHGGVQDDIFWNSNDGEADHLWTSRNDGTFASTRTTGTPPVDAVPVVGDFGGDHHEDILWYGRGAAADALWIADGAGQFRRSAVTISGDYRVQAVDNATGLDQVMFYARSAGRATIWVFSADGSHVSRSSSAPANAVMLIGRFSNDGCADVYWYARTGSDPLWELDCAGLNRAVRFMTMIGEAEPYIGQFSPGRGTQDDILWVDPTGIKTMLSENLTAGRFTNSYPTMPHTGTFLRTANGYAAMHRWDPATGRHSIWFKVPGGDSFNADLTNTAVPSGYQTTVGAFVGTGEDILWYRPGSAGERLFWQVG